MNNDKVWIITQNGNKLYDNNGCLLTFDNFEDAQETVELMKKLSPRNHYVVKLFEYSLIDGLIM